MIAGVAVRCQKFRMPCGSGGGQLERARRVGAVWNDPPVRQASGLYFAPAENPDAAASRILVRNRDVFYPVRETGTPCPMNRGESARSRSNCSLPLSATAIWSVSGERSRPATRSCGPRTTGAPATAISAASPNSTRRRRRARGRPSFRRTCLPARSPEPGMSRGRRSDAASRRAEKEPLYAGATGGKRLAARQEPPPRRTAPPGAAGGRGSGERDDIPSGDEPIARRPAVRRVPARRCREPLYLRLPPR